MKGDSRRAAFCAAVLILLTLLAYSRVPGHEFLSFDDEGFITGNSRIQSGLTLDAAAWAFTTFHESNWIPLTWLSHMMDVQVFGLEPSGHHLTSLALHVVNGILLFLVMKAMTGALWRSFLVAALFALHPLHVESVAWVSERRDVLSTFFWLLTMAAYLHYARAPGRKRYLIIVMAFVLGLLAKPMLVTLPFVLALLDYWPLNRLRRHVTSPGTPSWHRSWFSTELLMEKVPLLALSAASAVITYLAQQKHGAVVTLKIISFGSRLANAALSYCRYLWKMIWPHSLSAYYPHPDQSLPLWPAALSALLLVCLCTLVVWKRNRPYLLVGWFWYVGTLLPVIGLVQIGNQAMADRYTYVPMIGISVMVAWGFSGPAARVRSRWIPGAAVALLLLALTLASRTQAGYWRSDSALFNHALEVDPDNFWAHYGIGNEYYRRGEYQNALESYRKSLSTAASFAGSQNNLGSTYLALGRYREALGPLHKAMALEPDSSDPYNNLGMVYAGLKEYARAIEYFDRALRLDPGLPQPHINKGLLYVVMGDHRAALEEYEILQGMDPKLASQLRDALFRKRRSPN